MVCTVIAIYRRARCGQESNGNQFRVASYPIDQIAWSERQTLRFGYVRWQTYCSFGWCGLARVNRHKGRLVSRELNGLWSEVPAITIDSCRPACRHVSGSLSTRISHFVIQLIGSIGGHARRAAYEIFHPLPRGSGLSNCLPTNRCAGTVAVVASCVPKTKNHAWRSVFFERSLHGFTGKP